MADEKTTAEKAKKPTIADVLTAVTEMKGDLEKKIEEVSARVADLEEPKMGSAEALHMGSTKGVKTFPQPAPVEYQNSTSNAVAQGTVASHSFVPPAYREIVDSILNRSFGIEVEMLHDMPAFNFTIVVPDKYSNMTAEYRQMYKVDRRPKIIDMAMGLNGVREWCERVFNNFNPDTRALIVADRVNMN